MKTVLNYLAMESTWRGMIQIATAAGVVIAPPLAAGIIATGLGAVGIINFFKNK